MTPERFRQIEELYHAARGGTADQRAALLAQTDPELRREVESLLAERPNGEFVDRPAIQNAQQLWDDPAITGLAAGSFLGPYRIEYKLGEGGMRRVSLEEKAAAWVGKLSGGQKQRLAVACALVGDPDLLFLDEPTTGLDPQARRQLWDIIRDFGNRGRTVLLTTHYMRVR